jgi:apolipoprotein N-acyltransferase
VFTQIKMQFDRRFFLLLLSVLSGLLLSLAWPSRGFAPLLFIAFIPLLLVEDRISISNDKFSRFVLFGLTYLSLLVWNVLTTWWVCNASLFGGMAAIGCNTLLMSIVFILFHRTKKLLGRLAGYLSLVFYWIGFEYFHFDWDLSWPWLTLGDGFAAYHKWIQWYEYTGILGGSAWILVVNILIFLLLKDHFEKTACNKIIRVIGIILLILAPISYSVGRYNSYVEKKDPVPIVVVQPNIDPYNEKFSGLSSEEQLAKLLKLASSEVDSNTLYVVAPETALTEGIWEEELDRSQSVHMIKAFLAGYPKLNFVGGLSSNKMYHEGEKLSTSARKFKDANRWYDDYNTAMQIDPAGKIQLYHKSKLVPGVEKVPFPFIFKHFENLAVDLGGTTGSLGIQKDRSVFCTLDGKHKVGAVICYESIYGEFVGGYIKNNAQLIFIITNDGWWGDTPGYKQHVQYGRLRAIETRRSIARSANTGTSCFINQRGDILDPTQWWEPAVIKADINANDVITFYTKHGDYIGRTSFYGAIGFLLAGLVNAFLKRKALS